MAFGLRTKLNPNHNPMNSTNSAAAMLPATTADCAIFQVTT